MNGAVNVQQQAPPSVSSCALAPSACMQACSTLPVNVCVPARAMRPISKGMYALYNLVTGVHT
jgi:hypothetical protein